MSTMERDAEMEDAEYAEKAQLDLSPSADADALAPRWASKNEERRARKKSRKEKDKMEKWGGLTVKARRHLTSIQKTVRTFLNFSEPGYSPLEWSEPLAVFTRSSWGVATPYRSLPLSYGPNPVQGIEMLDSVIDRPPKYSAKMLPQEYSLLHKLWQVFGGDLEGAAVVDIGAGNGCLATLAAALFGCVVVCLDRSEQREELRAENALPESLKPNVIRWVADIGDCEVEEMRRRLAEKGVTKMAVVAKHLCGQGTDLAIEFVARVQLPVAGVVMATCCSHKIDAPDYLRIYGKEDPEYWAPEGKLFNGSSPKCQGCDDVARLPLEVDAEALERRLSPPEFVTEASRHCSWRTTTDRTDVERQFGELFEDILQAPRKRWLQTLFGSVSEVRFVTTEHSLQNRCLIAPCPDAADGKISEDAFSAFYERQVAHIRELNGGRLQCKPKGLASVKYEYDGM